MKYRNSEKKLSFREEVANEFIKVLEENSIDFIKGWNFAETGFPENATTKLSYNGINALYLKMVENQFNYNDNRWLTFNQIKEKGYKLKYGSKGAKVEYYIPYDYERETWITFDEYNKNKDVTFINKDNVEIKKYGLKQKLYTVFNASAVEGIDPKELKIKLNKIQEEKVVEKVASSLNVSIVEQFNSKTAFYSLKNDNITIPIREQFKAQGYYAATVMHELGHSTGHSSRLNRDMGYTFGTQKYAYEELVAEITSAFMGEYVESMLSDDVKDNHKAYVQSWIKAIKDDKNILFKAIKDATVASDYMIEKANLKEYVNELKENKEINSDIKIENTEKSIGNEKEYKVYTEINNNGNIKNDYWRIEFNETDGKFISKDYAGQKITKEIIDEIKEIDEKINMYNEIAGKNAFGEITDKWLGCFKFYLEHIVNDEVVENMRLDIGDGNKINSTEFECLYNAIGTNKDMENENIMMSI